MTLKVAAMMWLVRRLQSLQPAGGVAGDDSDPLLPAAHNDSRRGRRIMRQMLIAAAIAAGLVALWAALLPLAA